MEACELADSPCTCKKKYMKRGGEALAKQFSIYKKLFHPPTTAQHWHQAIARIPGLLRSRLTPSAEARKVGGRVQKEGRGAGGGFLTL